MILVLVVKFENFPGSEICGFPGSEICGIHFWFLDNFRTLFKNEYIYKKLIATLAAFRAF